MSLFITFEGAEGSGKSVQARALYQRLSSLAIPAILTHEPGSTPTGERVARLLKWARDTDISPLTELLLFSASRAQLVREVIQPALQSGKVVICDRYTDSTVAYQAYGRGLDLEIIKVINSIATQGLIPDLKVLLDIPVEEGLARKRGKKHDRFEQEDVAFHRKVRDGYLKMATDKPERWLVIEAIQSKGKIRQIIWQKVTHLLANRGAG